MLLRLWIISMLAVMTLPATSQEDSCKTVHRIAADVVPATIFHTNEFLRGGNDEARTMNHDMTFTLKYAFMNREEVRPGSIYQGVYQGVGMARHVVRFKDIASAETTPMSSRFVQKENVLSLESIYVGYEFYDGWIKKLGLSSLKLQWSMRDVFRASTIRSERGISYPFARSMEAGISFNF